MILYELALETGERSAELAERARTLGMTGATPTTDLTAPQVAALRAAVLLPSSRDSVGPTDAAPPESWPSDPAAGAAPPAHHDDGQPVSSLPPPPGRGPAPDPGSVASAGSPPPPGPSSVPGQTPDLAMPPPARPSSSSGRSVPVVIGATVGGLGLIGVLFFVAVTFLGTSAEPRMTQIDMDAPVSTPEAASAKAPIERCQDLASDPDGERLGPVCAALTPPGTPRSAAAAAALTGGLDNYVSPAPERFCPSARNVLALTSPTPYWPTQRERLLAARETLRTDLVEVAETGPPRWVSDLSGYAETVGTQLAALVPDSPDSVWGPVEERDAATETPASENLDVAIALSCSPGS